MKSLTLRAEQKVGKKKKKKKEGLLKAGEILAFHFPYWEQSLPVKIQIWKLQKLNWNKTKTSVLFSPWVWKPENAKSFQRGILESCASTNWLGIKARVFWASLSKHI